MAAFVVDASATLPWCFAEENLVRTGVFPLAEQYSLTVYDAA